MLKIGTHGTQPTKKNSVRKDRCRHLVTARIMTRKNNPICSARSTNLSRSRSKREVSEKLRAE